MNGATEIHVTTHTFHAIPLLECLPAGPGPFPLVFFLPGFTGSRQDGLSLGCRLAQRGIAMLALDPLFHGERAHLTSCTTWPIPSRAGSIPPKQD